MTDRLARPPRWKKRVNGFRRKYEFIRRGKYRLYDTDA